MTEQNSPADATLVPAKGITSGPFAQTLLPPSSASATAATLSPPQVGQFCIPSGTGFDEETRRLLHYRLIRIHSAICIVMAGLVSMSLLGDSIFPVEAGMGRWSLEFPWLVFIESFAGTMFLWLRPWASLRTLRRLELMLFALIALLGSAARYRVLTPPREVESPHPHYEDIILRYGGAVTNLPFIFSIMIYGVLVPNTRQRSVIVVAGLCITPLIVTLIAAVESPAHWNSFAIILPMTAMSVFMAGVIAVVSAARTQTLRRAEFDARREAQQVGPYTLKRKLGEGGMGEVYLAEHKLLKRPCAVKFVRAELAANQSNALRFEREVRAMTALTHFHTVRIYDYGRTDDGAFYYVMEYLDGLTLDSLVRKAGPLEPARAIYLLRQLCGALAEAHAAGLVHRDLKPSNIVIATLGGQHDIAKLLDFGLVQNLGTMDSDPRLTQTGTVLGTPMYMCPEQAGGEVSIDARGDIYSLGAVAFFALSGRPPFAEPSIGKLLAAHLTQPPPFLTEIRKEVPNDVARVIERCLAKNPSERFQSAQELEAALSACDCASDWSATRAAEWWSQVDKADKQQEETVPLSPGDQG